MNEQTDKVLQSSGSSWLGSRLKPWINALISHRFGVFIFLGSMLVIATLIAATSYWLEKKEHAYFAEFETITENIDLDQLISDEAKTADLIKKLSTLRDQHPRYDAAALSSFYLGEIHFRQKKHNEAITHYQQYLRHLPHRASYRALVLQSIGYAYEELKQHKDAAEYFLQAATLEQAPLRDQAYMSAGRSYENNRDNKTARLYYQKVVDEFPQSTLVAMARTKLQQLTDTPPKP